MMWLHKNLKISLLKSLLEMLLYCNILTNATIFRLVQLGKVPWKCLIVLFQQSPNPKKRPKALVKRASLQRKH